MATRGRPHLETADPCRVLHGDDAVVLTRDFPRPLDKAWISVEAAFPPTGLVDLVIEWKLGDRSLFERPALVARNHYRNLFRSPGQLTGAALHISGSGDLLPTRLKVIPVSPLGLAAAILRRGWDIVRTEPRTFTRRVIAFALRLSAGRASLAPSAAHRANLVDPYEEWITLRDEHPIEDRVRHLARVARMTATPFFSILVPAGRDESKLTSLLESLEAQIYPHWELIVASREGEDRATRTLASRKGLAPDRLKRCHVNDSRPAALLNEALKASAGDYAVALAPGQLLRPHALVDVALAVAAVPSARLIYADEDEIDPAGRRSDPRFKPAWSPDLARVCDYLGDPTFIRVDTLKGVGGWRHELSPCEAHDLKLRVSETLTSREIVHIAKVLLHSEAGSASHASPGPIATRKQVILEHLERTGLRAHVEEDVRSPHPRVVFERPTAPPLVSLVIPTRDQVGLLRTCVASVLEMTSYPNVEIIVVDNGSQEQATLDQFEAWKGNGRISILHRPGPFNYSSLNNDAVRQARGSLLGFINNDIEVISADWLDEMVGYAVQPRIGCVGAKLLYPDRSLQHGGIVLGIGQASGLAHKGAARDDRGYLDRLVTVQNVSAVIGACLLVRKDVYLEVGGFDEKLAVGFNDDDLCLKVRAKGYLNVWTPFAELYHHESISRGLDVTVNRARRFAQELAAMQKRWGRDLISDPYYSPHLTIHSEDFGLRLS